MRYLLIGLVAVRAMALSNSVTLSDTSGGGQTNRPFTISRVFKKGEILRYAQPRLNGVPFPIWQCDVKTRWKDGSVAHALISFRAAIPKRGSVTVDFVNQGAAPSGGLDQAGMEAFLETAPGARDGWGAVTATAAGGISHAANARTMLAAGKWRYWLRGPVVTQVIVEEITPGRFTYDWGYHCTAGCTAPYTSAAWADAANDGQKSLHPIFVLTFYPGWAGVQVEQILENTWISKLQDLRYDLTLQVAGGPGRPLANWLTRSGLDHPAKTRWRQVRWSGQAPNGWTDQSHPGINVDYNFAYLEASKVIPYYDPATPAQFSGDVADFYRNLGKDDPNWCYSNLAHCGNWVKVIDNAGGRGDLGLIPRWYVEFLYTSNAKLYPVLIGNGLAGGNMPLHLRETIAGATYDTVGHGEAFARPVSIDTRTTWTRWGSAADSVSAKDRPVFAGPVTCYDPVDLVCTHKSTTYPANQWITVDDAHAINTAYVPYLITGDWYFLTELQFYAAWLLGDDPTMSGCFYSRHGRWGIVREGTAGPRNVAWAQRAIGEAAFMTPDNTPEKNYFTQKINYNLAVEEGRLNVADGDWYSACTSNPYNSATENSPWCWGRRTVAQIHDGGTEPNTLGYLGLAAGEGGDLGIDSQKSNYADSAWMYNYRVVTLGHLAELGLAHDNLRKAAGKWLLHALIDPAYNGYLLSDERFPARDRSGRYFTSWAQIFAATKLTLTLAERVGASAHILKSVETLHTGDSMMADPGQYLTIDNEVMYVGDFNWNGHEIAIKERGARGTKAVPHEKNAVIRRSLLSFATYQTSDAQHGYPYIARAAASYLTGITDGSLTGERAWAWIADPERKLATPQPQWNIIPRPRE